MNKQSDTLNIVKPSAAITNAIKSILYPMVHLLIRTGIHFPQLAELLKEIYIDVADKEFPLNGKKQTQTRLSFITGVHRKDVKRLLETPKNTNESIEEPDNINLGVKLISTWLKEARFTNQKGAPMELPLKSKTDASFDELVETVYKQNIRSRVILDEWLSAGIVKVNNKKVQLRTDAYIPKENQNEKAFFLGQNVADHLNAAYRNMLSDSPEFFERCVYYEGLSHESIIELKELVNKNGMNLLKEINKKAAELKQHDKQKNGVKQRINIGLYLYHQNKDANDINNT